MTQAVGEHQPAIIVTDASVLINFLRIDRTDLLAAQSHAFLATDHVAAEITDRYPDQRQRFAAAVAAGAISETRVTTPEEIRLSCPLPSQQSTIAASRDTERSTVAGGRPHDRAHPRRGRAFCRPPNGTSSSMCLSADISRSQQQPHSYFHCDGFIH